MAVKLLFAILFFLLLFFFFFSSRRRHTRSLCDWSSDVCSSDLNSAVIVQITALLNNYGLTLPAVADQTTGFISSANVTALLNSIAGNAANDIKIGRASCRERV